MSPSFYDDYASFRRSSRRLSQFLLSRRSRQAGRDYRVIVGYLRVNDCDSMITLTARGSISTVDRYPTDIFDDLRPASGGTRGKCEGELRKNRFSRDPAAREECTQDESHLVSEALSPARQNNLNFREAVRERHSALITAGVAGRDASRVRDERGIRCDPVADRETKPSPLAAVIKR